jgi:L-iditol 2-dehydrogenase
MLAVQLIGLKKINTIQMDKPEIKKNNEVLIKVKRVGICGSDIHYYKTGKIGSQIVTDPFIIGHEMSGVVEKVGPMVSKIKAGDRVAVDPLIYCSKCDQCKIKRFHTCRNQEFLGCPGQIEGCLKEYIVLPEICCFPIPVDISYDEAVLCEPLSVACYSAAFAQNLKGKKIGILGAGPIGLGVLLFSEMLNAGKIYITDILDYRLEAAGKQGAGWTGNPEKIDCVKEILSLEKDQLDYVFECCGKQEAVNQGLQLLKPGGKLIIVGIPEFDDFYFNAHIMRRNEITIQNVRRQNNSMKKTISYVAKRKINPAFMISHHFSLSEISKAFELVSGYQDNVLKAVIDFE